MADLVQPTPEQEKKLQEALERIQTLGFHLPTPMQFVNSIQVNTYPQKGGPPKKTYQFRINMEFEAEDMKSAYRQLRQAMKSVSCGWETDDDWWDEDGNLGNPRELQEAAYEVITEEEEEPPEELLRCKICERFVPANQTHRHQGEFVGECCWDERLRMTE